MPSVAGKLPRGYHLRELAADDGPAFGRLFDDSPDTGMIRFRPVFQVDPYLALTYGGASWAWSSSGTMAPDSPVSAWSLSTTS